MRHDELENVNPGVLPDALVDCRANMKSGLETPPTLWGYKRAGWQKSSGSGFLGPLAGLGGGGKIIGPTLFGPTLQQTDLSTDRMVFGPIHVF